MKKLFAMLLALCMTLSLAALAESADGGIIDPFAEEQPAAEEAAPAEESASTGEAASAEEVAAAPTPMPMASNAFEPEGEERYMSEAAVVPEWGIATPTDVMIDEIHARDAEAEDSNVIRSKPGCRALGVRVYYHPYNNDQSFSEAFQARMYVGDQVLDCRRFYESMVRGSVAAKECSGVTMEMTAGGPYKGGLYKYLESAEDRTEPFHYEGSHVYTSDDENTYYMYDVVAQIPEEALVSGTPIYLVLTMGERTFWYQVM